MDVILYVIEPIVQGDFFVCRWLHSIIYPINRQAHECFAKQLLFSVFMQNHMCVRLSVCKCTLCLNDIEGGVLNSFTNILRTSNKSHQYVHWNSRFECFCNHSSNIFLHLFRLSATDVSILTQAFGMQLIFFLIPFSQSENRILCKHDTGEWTILPSSFLTTYPV